MLHTDDGRVQIRLDIHIPFADQGTGTRDVLVVRSIRTEAEDEFLVGHPNIVLYRVTPPSPIPYGA